MKALFKYPASRSWSVWWGGWAVRLGNPLQEGWDWGQGGDSKSGSSLAYPGGVVANRSSQFGQSDLLLIPDPGGQRCTWSSRRDVRLQAGRLFERCLAMTLSSERVQLVGSQVYVGHRAASAALDWYAAAGLMQDACSLEVIPDRLPFSCCAEPFHALRDEPAAVPVRPHPPGRVRRPGLGPRLLRRKLPCPLASHLRCCSPILVAVHDQCIVLQSAKRAVG